jgi:hypothetical protein
VRNLATSEKAFCEIMSIDDQKVPRGTITNAMGQRLRLGALRSASSPTAPRSRPLSFVMQVAGITVLLGAAIVGLAQWRTGSMQLVFPYFGGQRLPFETTRVVLDKVPQGEIVAREVRVVNLSSDELTLLGALVDIGSPSHSTFLSITRMSVCAAVDCIEFVQRGPGYASDTLSRPEMVFLASSVQERGYSVVGRDQVGKIEGSEGIWNIAECPGR